MDKNVVYTFAILMISSVVINNIKKHPDIL